MSISTSGKIRFTWFIENQEGEKRVVTNVALSSLTAMQGLSPQDRSDIAWWSTDTQQEQLP